MVVVTTYVQAICTQCFRLLNTFPVVTLTVIRLNIQIVFLLNAVYGLFQYQTVYITIRYALHQNPFDSS